ncbi:MAG: polysaccharide biosynthesis C-terminal domain-containing protein [Deltaproteobacteria bacterium]|nr:polysaccharide biosynthesis C-terminal domain-containing protein [Candidatus Anaeroferrophillacea bacterium]
MLTLANLCGRGLNFILFIVIANFYGANPETDWFFFTYGIAYFCIGICYYATESALVPVWHRMPGALHVSFGRRAYKVALAGTVGIFAFMIIGGLFIAPMRGIAVPGIQRSALTVIAVLAGQPGLAFLSSFFSSFHQYRQRYFLSTVHLALRSIGVLAVLAIFRNADILVLATAFLVGEIIRMLLLFPAELRGVFRGMTSQMPGHVFWHAYRDVAWMTLALAGTVVNPLVDLAMVGHLRSGSVTLVEYAGRIRGMPVLALGGILIFLLGDWSSRHHQHGHLLTWKPVRRAAWQAFGVCVPAVVLLFAGASWWIPLIFRSPLFGTPELASLKDLLWWYLPGVPFLAGSLVLSRALLVIQQARLLAIISLCAMIVNIAVNVIMIALMDLPGVALSTTVVDGCVWLGTFLVARNLLCQSDNVLDCNGSSAAW